MSEAARQVAAEVPDAAGCRVCGEDAGYEPVLGVLDRCRACSFVTYRGAAPADLTELYGEEYFAGTEYPDYLGQEDALRRSMHRHLAQMRQYGHPTDSLLELGCAYGLFLDEARPRFGSVTGVDICAGPLRHARERLGLDVRCGDFLALDLGRGRFGTVCMWDTIEHLAAPDAYLRKAARVLAPGGMLFLTTGDIGSLNARVRGRRWRHIHPPTHLQYFSRRTIRRLLDRTGFEVVGIGTAAYYHTIFNVLATIRARRGAGAGVAAAALRVLGEPRARQLGLWLDLGDNMFVAARRREGAAADPS